MDALPNAGARIAFSSVETAREEHSASVAATDSDVAFGTGCLITLGSPCVEHSI